MRKTVTMRRVDLILTYETKIAALKQELAQLESDLAEIRGKYPTLDGMKVTVP